ncbi:MINDY family deubiquitinase NDAI_0D00940 [Naumovozyma dairenensis CBS 421]|uniref:MINDY deubiquitinase domain-containing protein n=1 Tax=Naumovozyma dairenensis (strain ATCC 10597 / BCRC 20456 / CBS 421 / NBRC 0211 / NRRL Y-12639) TaxID=1071378 RepID=G0W9E7_NAUDC|nr:hypothetical protein NDAI_0D00940 [Naumovozyma dairenensis CBS 421]CCD24408.1 hypothetical protein NDAI_0D00940 [Naumovozyma dairenensis CBS 421]
MTSSLPATNTKSKPIRFDVKNIKIRDTPHKILLQNENGPCALLALINLLVLSSNEISSLGVVTKQELKKLISKDSIPITAATTTTTTTTTTTENEDGIKKKKVKNGKVSLEELIQILANNALQGNTLEDQDYQNDVDQLLHLLPQLHTGLNINPRFDGTFEDSKELSIFRLFGIPLVHGWVIDHDKYPAIYHLSYEDAQNILTEASEIEETNDADDKDKECNE